MKPATVAAFAAVALALATLCVSSASARPHKITNLRNNASPGVAAGSLDGYTKPVKYTRMSDNGGLFWNGLQLGNCPYPDHLTVDGGQSPSNMEGAGTSGVNSFHLTIYERVASGQAYELHVYYKLDKAAKAGCGTRLGYIVKRYNCATGRNSRARSKASVFPSLQAYLTHADLVAADFCKVASAGSTSWLEVESGTEAGVLRSLKNKVKGKKKGGAKKKGGRSGKNTSSSTSSTSAGLTKNGPKKGGPKKGGPKKGGHPSKKGPATEEGLEKMKLLTPTSELTV